MTEESTGRFFRLSPHQAKHGFDPHLCGSFFILFQQPDFDKYHFMTDTKKPSSKAWLLTMLRRRQFRQRHLTFNYRTPDWRNAEGVKSPEVATEPNS